MGAKSMPYDVMTPFTPYLGDKSVARSHPKLARGQVWCTACGRTQKVDSGAAMRSGWPKCCGYTMTIDAPGER
jgi:hypothetical protein